MRTEDGLPEVILLRDARGARPENAAGIGEFWYEPEVWTLPLSPEARVLYAGLCSFLGHKEINREDLRNTLKDRPDTEIARALQELVGHDLLVPDAGTGRGYEVHPVDEFG
ncbi:hypothetical protein BH18ACT11_BH18ACT11_12040 [soil metagenome]